MRNILKSGYHFEAESRLVGFEEELEILYGVDIKKGHEILGIHSCDCVRLSLLDDFILLKHPTHSALGALHHIDIIGDLEVSLGVGDEEEVLVGGLILVEEDLSGLGAPPHYQCGGRSGSWSRKMHTFSLQSRCKR